MREITKAAPTIFKECERFTFDQIYLDKNEDFIQAVNVTHKDCISSIYMETTILLRNLTNFTAEYGLSEDIFFYYRSDNYRDNYRECIVDYADKVNSRQLSDLYDLYACSSRVTALETYQNIRVKSEECEDSVKQKMDYKGRISLTNWSVILDENNNEQIKAYGEAYMCVLNKYFSVGKQYDWDIDVFFHYFDFGALTISYVECMENKEYTVIQNGMANKNFDSNFFGHLKKCCQDRMAIIDDPEKTFFHVDNIWRDDITKALNEIQKK